LTSSTHTADAPAPCMVAPTCRRSSEPPLARQASSYQTSRAALPHVPFLRWSALLTCSPAAPGSA
jgi:hypothetical protein